MTYAVYIEYNGNSYNLPDPPGYNGSYVCNVYNGYFYLINLPSTSGAYFYTPGRYNYHYYTNPLPMTEYSWRIGYSNSWTNNRTYTSSSNGPGTR